MPDYSKSKLYKVVCGSSGHYYIGSTTLPLSVRLSLHKSYRQWSPTPLYTFLRTIPEESITIEALEDYPCSSRQDLVMRENELLLRHLGQPLCLNKNKSYRTPEERKAYNRMTALRSYYNNQEERKKRQLEYYYAHREEIKAKNLDRYHREKGGAAVIERVGL